jgi:hypothetical protein
MTGFPDLQPEAINAVLDYIKNETFRPGAREDEEKLRDSIEAQQESPRMQSDTSFSGVVSGLKNTLSCPDDTIYVNTKEQPESNFEHPAEYVDTASSTIQPAESMEWLRKGFNDANPTSGRYDFEINTLGWYNVDAYVQGYAGTISVKLWGELEMTTKADMQVYLFCPRNKMLSVIHDIKDGKFFFNKIDDGIPLFPGDRAILFAFGSRGDKMYYGISEFWIQREQTIKIKVQETTEDIIKQVLKKGHIDGINLGVEKKEKRILKNNCDGFK